MHEDSIGNVPNLARVFDINRSIFFLTRQVQIRKAPTAVAKQVSEDDEISRIKKQNKSAPAQSEALEERQPIAPSSVHAPVREPLERETEDTSRRTSIAR